MAEDRGLWKRVVVAPQEGMLLEMVERYFLDLV